jgi:hypothetical protein
MRNADCGMRIEKVNQLFFRAMPLLPGRAMIENQQGEHLLAEK